jgi:outer membrane protein assembly factor BamD (BamD/ComL family)
MATHGWRFVPLLAGLLLALAGCSTVPAAPTAAATQPAGAVTDKNSYDDTSGDGWLFGRLFGKKPAASGSSAAGAASSAAPKFDPAVTPASATVPAVDPAVQKASAAQPLPTMADPAKAPPSVVYLADDSDEDDGPLRKKKEKESAFDWLDFDPEGIYQDIKAAFGYGPDRKLARKYFNEGLSLYEQKRFSEAAAKFKSAAGRWPDSTLEEDAMFMQAECLFFADKYPKADDVFANLLKKYDNSRHLDKIMVREFAIARYWEQAHAHRPYWFLMYNALDSTRPHFDTAGNARKAYEVVALNDPTGPLADDALMAVGNWYFTRDRYDESADYYDRLRKEHPNSTHIIDAHLLLVKSKQLAYQGPLYDGTPLKDTGRLAEETVQRFGNRLGEEKANLVDLENRVDVEMARRDWAMAEFYEGKKQYGAARFYYNQIMKDYPQMEVAHAAQQRLEEIKGYPDKPKNYFKYLTDLFPDGK